MTLIVPPPPRVASPLPSQADLSKNNPARLPPHIEQLSTIQAATTRPHFGYNDVVCCWDYRLDDGDGRSILGIAVPRMFLGGSLRTGGDSPLAASCQKGSRRQRAGVGDHGGIAQRRCRAVDLPAMRSHGPQRSSCGGRFRLGRRADLLLLLAAHPARTAGGGAGHASLRRLPAGGGVWSDNRGRILSALWSPDAVAVVALRRSEPLRDGLHGGPAVSP